VAQSLLKNFKAYSEAPNAAAGRIELVKGDFTTIEMRQRAITADVLFVNNAHGIFGVRSVQKSRNTLDHYVARIALEMKG